MSFDKVKIYGYLRVSTEKQDLQGNKNEIICLCTKLGYNATNIIWILESVTGTKHWKDRQLNLIVNQIKKDDIIIMSEISRISRKFMSIIEFFSVIKEKGAYLHFTKSDFKIDDSIQSQALIFAFSISSQLERELISERTKTALKRKKLEGVKLGRPVGKGKCKLDQFRNEILLSLNEGVPKSILAKKYNVTNSTIHNFIKKNL